MFNTYLTTTLEYNQELCIGCAMCVNVCPHAVFKMNDRLAEIIRAEACMECGACQKNCPTAAITVDAGVGCAMMMVKSALSGQEQSECSCG